MTQQHSPSATDPVAWLEHALATRPEHCCIESADGTRFSYADVFDWSGRFAAALGAQGVRAGDRVAAQVEKSPQAFLLYLGCLRLGAVFLPLNTAYPPAELAYFLQDASPSLFVTRPDERAALEAALAPRMQLPPLLTLGSDADGSLMALAERCDPLAFVPFGGAADALAALLYTSGTTGRSKGAMLSRANLASNAAALVRAWRFSGDDVLLHALPVFHAHGLFIAANTMLACGGTMLFLPRFDADEVMRLMPRASAMMGIPTFYTRLLAHPGLTRAATAHMRLFVSGSAPLLVETHRQFERATGHLILERYAMTETVVITTNPYQGLRLPGSVGSALPGVELTVRDPDTGAACGADQVGMIEVRGPNVFSGYWNMPDKTREELRADGYFITGDLGMIDAAGYVHIVGRGKDLIITGGYNVYPKEVEGELDALPGVLESAVIGLPHRDLGEGVTAVVVAHPGQAIDEAGLLAAMDGRLARFKLPKRVLVVPELPRNAMGKVQKNLLRDAYAGLYR